METNRNKQGRENTMMTVSYHILVANQAFAYVEASDFQETILRYI